MKNHYSIPVLLTILFTCLFVIEADAQNIQSIFGCDEMPPVDQVVECALCNEDAFLGHTGPYTPSNPFSWCGTIENDQFIGFHSDPTGVIIFQVEVLSSTQGGGIQVGIEDEDRNLWACIDEITPFQGPTTYQFQVAPSTNFFLRIDGFNGDICEFIFTPITGLKRRPPVVEVTNTSGQTQIDYLFNDCVNGPPPDTIDGCIYAYDYEFSPSNSGTVQVSTTSNSYREVFTWADSIPVRADVDRVLTLISQPAGRTCDSILRFDHLSHFLDLDVYGGFTQNQLWNCSDERVVYELEKNQSLTFQLFEGGMQRYVLEAAGLHRRLPASTVDQYFRYEVRQNGQQIASNLFTPTDFSDTLAIDFSLGFVRVVLTNPFSTPLEYALTRLDPITPWVPQFDCTQSSLEICLDEELTASCDISNKPCANGNNCYQAIESIRDAELFALGSNIPLTAALNPMIGIDGKVSINIEQQTIATLGIGIYTARITLGIEQALGGFCAASDTTSFAIDFEVIASRDTVVFDTLFLSAGSTITIFQDSTVNMPQVITTPGNYVATVACTLFIQPVVLGAVAIDVGTIEVCPNECAYAPSGQLLTCAPGPFTITASNGITYTGELIVDNATPLDILNTNYTCDSLNGEWYVDLAWSGSEAPYLIDGQVFSASTARIGPFLSGQTINLDLSGSSACISGLSFVLSTPNDTIREPDLMLSLQGDSVTLFANLSSPYQLLTDMPGTYYAYSNCAVYVQTLLPPPASVNLGSDTLCLGDCLIAPTGETISCASGNFSFLASNDTTYFGEIFIDSATSISILSTDYTCDSLNGEWYVDLAWSGSEAPYLIDGQVFSDSAGRVGPFLSGQTINLDLSGSSACVSGLSFVLSTPNDTIREPDLMLSVQRDSVTLFANLSSPYQLQTDMPGTYFAYSNCAVYMQTLLPPPASVNLGSDTLCLGDCLIAPTGETISCARGSYSFLASNDTTYLGEIFIDSATSISILSTEYTCDSLNGEWYLDLVWSGSEGPYVLNDQVVNDTTGRAGPFPNGQTIDFSLSGSSPCVDTVFISGSYSCVSSTNSIQHLGFEVKQIGTSMLEVNSPSYGWMLSLVDVLGREVFSTQLQQNTNQLFIGDLVRGTYFIVVQNRNQLASEKWVKR